MRPSTSYERNENAMSLICGYCTHCKGRVCEKEIPYYAVSIHCAQYQEYEPKEKISYDARSERTVKHSLVETF